jgi:hypothetical protein
LAEISEYGPVDEDEGSPFHHGANWDQAIVKTWHQENRRISGSPPGMPPPEFFSLQWNDAYKTRGDLGKKLLNVAIFKINGLACRKAEVSLTVC